MTKADKTVCLQRRNSTMRILCLDDEEQASLYDYYTGHLDDDYPYKAWYDRLPHNIAKVLANETLKEKVYRF